MLDHDKPRYSGALTLAAGLKGLAWATIGGELLVVVEGVIRWDGGEAGNGTDMTAGNVGLFTLAVVAMVLLPCLLGFLGYALEVLVGIFERSDKPRPPLGVTPEAWATGPSAASSR